LRRSGIRAAYNGAVTFFDTAEAYGPYNTRHCRGGASWSSPVIGYVAPGETIKEKRQKGQSIEGIYREKLARRHAWECACSMRRAMAASSFGRAVGLANGHSAM